MGVIQVGWQSQATAADNLLFQIREARSVLPPANRMLTVVVPLCLEKQCHRCCSKECDPGMRFTGFVLTNHDKHHVSPLTIITTPKQAKVLRHAISNAWSSLSRNFSMAFAYSKGGMI